MSKPLFKSHPNASVGNDRGSVVRMAGMVACILFSTLLPIYLVDDFPALSLPEGSANSVLINAMRFYSGDEQAVPDPDRYIADHDRYIAIVTYIGLPADSDMEATKSSVDEIIRKRVIPAFEQKGFQFRLETNEITDVRLYYNREHESGGTEVKVFCFVTSKAAFALVVG